MAGSTAAIGVSVSDMEKRLKLEKWKSQMLRNLNMFVSKIRLVVHNLPSSFTDDHLRYLFKNYSDSSARITEVSIHFIDIIQTFLLFILEKEYNIISPSENKARVMRDLKNLDATGRPVSKEYGFVTFTSHEDALKSLRNINNNPNVFSKNRVRILYEFCNLSFLCIYYCNILLYVCIYVCLFLYKFVILETDSWFLNRKPHHSESERKKNTKKS